MLNNTKRNKHIIDPKTIPNILRNKDSEQLTIYIQHGFILPDLLLTPFYIRCAVALLGQDDQRPLTHNQVCRILYAIVVTQPDDTVSVRKLIQAGANPYAKYPNKDTGQKETIIQLANHRQRIAILDSAHNNNYYRHNDEAEVKRFNSNLISNIKQQTGGTATDEQNELLIRLLKKGLFGCHTEDLYSFMLFASNHCSHEAVTTAISICRGQNFGWRIESDEEARDEMASTAACEAAKNGQWDKVASLCNGDNNKIFTAAFDSQSLKKLKEMLVSNPKLATTPFRTLNDGVQSKVTPLFYAVITKQYTTAFLLLGVDPKEGCGLAELARYLISRPGEERDYLLAKEEKEDGWYNNYPSAPWKTQQECFLLICKMQAQLHELRQLPPQLAPLRDRLFDIVNKMQESYVSNQTNGLEKFFPNLVQVMFEVHDTTIRHIGFQTCCEEFRSTLRNLLGFVPAEKRNYFRQTVTQNNWEPREAARRRLLAKMPQAQIFLDKIEALNPDPSKPWYEVLKTAAQDGSAQVDVIVNELFNLPADLIAPLLRETYQIDSQKYQIIHDKNITRRIKSEDIADFIQQANKKGANEASRALLPFFDKMLQSRKLPPVGPNAVACITLIRALEPGSRLPWFIILKRAARNSKLQNTVATIITKISKLRIPDIIQLLCTRHARFLAGAYQPIQDGRFVSLIPTTAMPILKQAMMKGGNPAALKQLNKACV